MMGLLPWPSAVVCALFVCLCWEPGAHAQDNGKHLCASAFTESQRLMRKGNLLEAKKKLVLCGGAECPEAMHADCQQWLTSVEASIPTVVFQVSSTSGPQPEEVQLSLDGQDALTLDSRAVSMDPGAHDIVFAAKGFRTASKRIVVSEGEKLRREEILLAPLSVARPADNPALPARTSAPAKITIGRPASRVTIPVIVASSGAAVAGLAAIYFGLEARSDDRGLDTCSPSCTREVVDHVRREYLWANLSIGLAVAGLTTAVVLFVFNGKSSNTSTTLGLDAGPGKIGLAATRRF
jgi:hypothetical protein